MTYRKENKLAFDEARKESFTERLKSIIGSRSVRAAAKDWGLSFSTLNNYVTRGTEPSFVAMQAIAYAEGISLDWLAFGTSDANMSQSINEGKPQTKETDQSDNLRLIWDSIFNSMERSDVEMLIKLIHNNGAKGVIVAASGIDDMNRSLLNLTNEEKERLLALHEAKKGASEEREVNEADNLTDKRQAG